jgi:hypothetical protein
MAKNLSVFLGASILFILFYLIGVFLDITIYQSGGIINLACVFLFAGFWYKILRRGKPVWQPGRRFWIRFSYISFFSLLGYAGLGDIFLLLGPLGLANIVFFFIDAYINWSDVSITNVNNMTESREIRAPEKKKDFSTATTITADNNDPVVLDTEAVMETTSQVLVKQEICLETTICPFCAEEIKVQAIKCKHCGEWLKEEVT